MGFLVRMILSFALIFGIYTQAGWCTALLAFLTVVSVEISNFLIVKLIKDVIVLQEAMKITLSKPNPVNDALNEALIRQAGKINRA